MKNRSSLLSIPTTAAALALLLAAAMVHAQPAQPPMGKGERCARYSEMTLFQVQQARRMDCAYSGPRWSAEYEVHNSWCLGQGPETLESELEFRRQELARCESGQRDAVAAPPPTMVPLEEAKMLEGSFEVLPPVTDKGLCEAYALTAAAQQRQNEEQSCGLNGPAWSADVAAHRSWCAHQDPANLQGETRGRVAALQSCLGGREQAVGSDARCTAYAAAGVHQVDLQEAKGCGFSGPRWSSDYLLHYRWCLQQQGQQPEVEKAERDRQLVHCGAAATPIPIPGPVKP